MILTKETLQSLIKKQFTLKMQLASGQLKQNHLLREVRKDIARYKTLSRKAELGVVK